jgi:cell division protein FtsZ
MDDAGTALMGVGKANGEDRALEAAKMAVDSPLLEVDIDGATGVLFNVTGGKDLKIHEIDQAASVIQQRISPDANFIFGARIDPDMPDGEIEVTVLATGFSDIDSQRILSADPMRARRPQMPSYVTQRTATGATV